MKRWGCDLCRERTASYWKTCLDADAKAAKPAATRHDGKFSGCQRQTTSSQACRLTKSFDVDKFASGGSRFVHCFHSKYVARPGLKSVNCVVALLYVGHNLKRPKLAIKLCCQSSAPHHSSANTHKTLVYSVRAKFQSWANALLRVRTPPIVYKHYWTVAQVRSCLFVAFVVTKQKGRKNVYFLKITFRRSAFKVSELHRTSFFHALVNSKSPCFSMYGRRHNASR